MGFGFVEIGASHMLLLPFANSSIASRLVSRCPPLYIQLASPPRPVPNLTASGARPSVPPRVGHAE
eukprot:6909029-Pyramimonas_sp.AAC.1